MLPINYLAFFEAGGFIFFFLILIREAYARNYWRLFEVISCAVFGLFLEIANTHFGQTYYYSPGFLIQLAHVPLAIGTGWAVIIYSAMRLSDQYNLPWKIRPAMDALTAVTLDLAIDAVAIRLHLWTWSIPLDQEWFGVPYENLVGWILVAFSFSFLIRYIRTLDLGRNLAKLLMVFSPAIAYTALMLGLALFMLAATLPYAITHWNSLQFENQISLATIPQVQFWKMLLLALIILGLVSLVSHSLYTHQKKWSKNFVPLPFFSLTAIHLFFAAAIFTTGLYQTLPILLALSAGSLLLHLLLHFLPFCPVPNSSIFYKIIKKMAAP